MRDFDFFLDSASRSSGERDGDPDGLNHNQLLSSGSNGQGQGQGGGVVVGVGPGGGHNYRYSPETTDYDSNCGDLDSECDPAQGFLPTSLAHKSLSLPAGLSGEMNGGVSTSCSNYAKYYASAMPVLEDGLSSGHTSDTENNNNKNLQQALANQGQGQALALAQAQGQTNLSASTSIGGSGGISMLMDMKRISTNNSLNSMQNLTTTTASTTDSNGVGPSPSNGLAKSQPGQLLHQSQSQLPPSQPPLLGQSPSNHSKVFKNIDPELDSLYSISKYPKI